MVLFIGSKEGEHANQKFTTQTKKTTFTFLHSSEKGRKKKRKNEKWHD